MQPNTSPFADQIFQKLKYTCGKSADDACDHDWYVATALAARDRVVDHWTRRAHQNGRKRVYYLSLEFLIGRLLIDVLTNLEMVEETRDALACFGIDLNHLQKLEPDAALGNGGLGRLAACYMDSMSSLAIPAMGYGIRYEQGLFSQRIREGHQEETPDDWLRFGNPWEFVRPEIEYPVRFGGFVEYVGTQPTARAIWYPGERVLAGAYDIPVVGRQGRHVNALRLWSARALSPLHLDTFNRGEHADALAVATRAQAISKVLYPGDLSSAGRELRLRQEYFFTAASLQDIVGLHLKHHGSLEDLAESAAIQMNDTHPAIAVAELMRILVDDQDFEWDQAWAITRKTLGFTNHTLLPEALETWPVEMFGRILPRHLQIIYLINWHHLNAARAENLDARSIADVSIIDENDGKRVRMAHLAFVGSHRTNGVSDLHSRLLRETTFKDLAGLYPNRIINKTNGISFRRWLHQANPELTALISDAIGPQHIDDHAALAKLEPFAGDAGFVERYAAVRRQNKIKLADVVRRSTGIRVDPGAIFDVQIKRFHEYKRQLLNLIETIALYRELIDGNTSLPPRVKILAGKAAPGYARAKLIIKLANDVAQMVNSDPRIADRLKIVFLPDYNVSLAQCIVSASDVSEQISTAGMEASGTGNMKLALNGAITIGTLDGANIEIREHVGSENVEIFGLTADLVQRLRDSGFAGAEAAGRSPRLQAVLDELTGSTLSNGDGHLYHDLHTHILDADPFMVAADFESYWAAQRAIDARRQDDTRWWASCVSNTARMGWFSSDRAIGEYAREIWDVPVRAA